MPILRAAILPLMLGLSMACEPAVPHSDLNLRVAAFSKGGRVPREFTADGADKSPAMEWSGAPPGTQAFSLVVDDPDAPVGTWTHWVLYDLPGSTGKLEENRARTPILESGAKQGKNSWGRIGWNGPSPPPGKPHRYFFRLYALSAATGLAPGADRAALDRAMKGKVLGESQWMGTYGR